MKYGLLAFAGSLLLAGAAHAAEPALVDHWSEPLVQRLLQSLGASGLERTTLAGQPGLLARTADGLSVGLYAKACSTQTQPAEPFCRGIEGIASFDAGKGVDRAALDMRLNHRYAAGKFMVQADGSICLTRYIDVDAGVSEANLRAQMAEFFALADAAKTIVWDAPTR